MAMEVMTQLERDLGRPVNPLEGLLRIGSDPDQPTDVRVQCMAECLPYIYPKLQTQNLAVSGAVDMDRSPAVDIDINAILMDPKLAEAAQTLSLGLVEAEVKASRQANGLADNANPRLLDYA